MWRECVGGGVFGGWLNRVDATDCDLISLDERVDSDLSPFVLLGKVEVEANLSDDCPRARKAGFSVSRNSRI